MQVSNKRRLCNASKVRPLRIICGTRGAHMDGMGLPSCAMKRCKGTYLCCVPIHSHGRTFTVVERNGKPLTGSPVHLNTITIKPHESYDRAFFANNPGIWMLYCHNLLHAIWGMDMMVMYNVSTPYTVGTASGNFPD